MIEQEYKICTRGIWDTTVPGIAFDENGVSNYAKIFDRLCEAYPLGEKGRLEWEKLIEKIKKDGKGKKYDCLIGVSGGTDSSYLMHLAKEKYNLRPLAVTFDNGWSSEISVKNIKKMTQRLGIDLETLVVDYEEMKSIHKAYMNAGLPWIDFPTDFAIKNLLLLVSQREKIGYIFNGHDFRSEGTQPNEWTHGDSKQLNFILRNFGSVKVKTLPYMNYYFQVYLSIIKGIKFIKPFYYFDYSKKSAQDLLINNYDWEYYGGHHHENIFTKFAIAYWLVKKHKIDKRKITLSAQILSGEISRSEALEKIKQPPYDPDQMERDKEYVIKKLELTTNEFENIWTASNKSIYDYPSYLGTVKKYSLFLKPLIKLVYHQPPTFLYQLEERSKR
jgi:N-acetyl sugar amidotransferase